MDFAPRKMKIGGRYYGFLALYGDEARAREDAVATRKYGIFGRYARVVDFGKTVISEELSSLSGRWGVYVSGNPTEEQLDRQRVLRNSKYTTPGARGW